MNISKVKVKSRINKDSENDESADVETSLLYRRAAGCQRVMGVLMESMILNLPALLTKLLKPEQLQLYKESPSW